MFKRVTILVAALTAFAFTAQADGPFTGDPKPNATQKKYFEWLNQAGGLRCEPKGTMKQLVSEPNKCYLNLDECPVSLNGLQGKLSGELKTLLHDLIKTSGDGDKLTFDAACPSKNGPQFTHLLGFKGVGYAGISAARADLIKLVANTARMEKAGANIRTGVAEALWLLGKDDAAIKALKGLVEYGDGKHRYKPGVIHMLASWKSDAIVDYCTNALTAERNDQLVRACINYLGQLGAKKAYPKLIRIMEKHEAQVIPALGTLGEKKAIQVLETYLEDQDGRSQKRIPAVVSLINLGKTEHMKELALYLAGDKPLSKRDKEKLAKKKAREAKRKKKRKKKAKKKEKRIDFKLAHQAAMESVRVTNPKVAKALTKALWATTKLIDDRKREWKPGVYATIALAQRGDKKAIQALPALLESPKEDIRKAVLDAIGGRWEAQFSNWLNRGSGVVADLSLLPAIYSYYDNEPKTRDKVVALKAAAAIRVLSAIK